MDGSSYGQQYAGQKVAALTFSPSVAAEHWYTGVYKSLDGFGEYDIIEALRMKGSEDRKESAFLLQSTDVIVAAVAFDASGRAGALGRLTVKSDGTVSKSVSLKSVTLRKGNVPDVSGKAIPAESAASFQGRFCAPAGDLAPTPFQHRRIRTR